MVEYHCMVCEDCDAPIPLLENDPQKQRQNPSEFTVKCSDCGCKALFDESEIKIRRLNRIPSFKAAPGFRNAEVSE